MADKVGEIYYEVGADIAPLLQASKQVSASLDGMGKGADKASGNMDGLERSASKTGKAVARAADDASQAAKIMERLGNEIAVLEEANQNGAKSAAVLAAQIAASKDATSAQSKEIGKLAEKLFEVKNAAIESAKSASLFNSEQQKAKNTITSLEGSYSVLSTQMESGGKSSAILQAQLKAGSSATQEQKEKIAQLAGSLFDLKEAQTAAANASIQARKDLLAEKSEAERFDSIANNLTQQISLLAEQQRSGARAAAVLASSFQAGANATESQKRQLADLAGSLYDAKQASAEESRTVAASAAAHQRAQGAISGLENELQTLSTQMQSGSRSSAILAAQLKAGEGATQEQKARIAELTTRLYDMKAAQDSAARATIQAAKQAAQQANDAAKLRSISSSLTQQIALLNEEQKNGARSAAMLAARLQAGSTATAAQRKEIGELAGKLYDLKQAQDQANASQQKSTGIMSGLKTGLTAIASAIAISQLVQYGKQFLEIADTMTQLQARIDRLSSSAKEGAATFQALSAIASASGSSLKDTEKLWEKLTSSLKSAGASNSQILTLTDTLQKIGRIGGSSTEEMANALRQFGQSIAGGTVRAEEFNSIIEQMPELARQMASGLGISVGELRKRMLEGKLSAEDALNAIMTQTGLVNQEFSKLPRTVDQATNSLTISFQEFVKQINDATGASTGMVHVIDSITSAIDRLTGKVPNATQQISDLASTADMFAKRARTYSWLGLDGWAAQAEGINAVSNKAAALVGDLAAISKANVSASSKPISITGTGDSKEVAKLEKSTKRKLELSKIEGEARARLQAQYDAEDAGITDSKRVKALQDEYAATEKNTSARKASTAEGKKSASQTESIAQKLANLKQQSELAGDSTRELSRDQAILSAQQSLGSAATEKDIKLAGQYAAAKWDTGNAIRAQAAAEKLLPETKENASYKQDVSDLQTALSAKKISQEQFNSTAEKLEQEHQVNLAKIRADTAAGVTPLQDAQGAIDPVQALANENARKLALIQQFETDKGVITANGLALMNAQNAEYEQARIDAAWKIWENQNQTNQLLGGAIDSLQGGATNAITGLINGTQSLQESLANIGTTILNSVVGGLVEMGLQYVKSMVMGQVAAAASLASTTTQASAAALAWAPAAMSASIATYGTAATVGSTAYAGALAMAQGMAVTGARKNGGPVSAGSMYQVGEGGMPEIYQASTGKQYMIPGDNGSVISNKDLAGSGGGGGVINQVNHFTFEGSTADTTQTQATFAKIAYDQSLKAIKDQQRPGGMLQKSR